jgi:hypothetical protein
MRILLAAVNAPRATRTATWPAPGRARPGQGPGLRGRGVPRALADRLGRPLAAIPGGRWPVDAEPVRALLEGTRRPGGRGVRHRRARRAAFHITQVYGHERPARRRSTASSTSGEGEEGYQDRARARGVPAGGGPVRGRPVRRGRGRLPLDRGGRRRGGGGVLLLGPGPGRAPHRRAGLARGPRLVGLSGLGDAARHARRLAVPVAMDHPGRADRGRGLPGAGRPRSPGRARSPGCPTGARAAWSSRWPPTSPCTGPRGRPLPGRRPRRPGAAVPLRRCPGRRHLVGPAGRGAGPWRGPPGRRPPRELLEELARDDLSPRPLDRPALPHLLAGAVDDPSGSGGCCAGDLPDADHDLGT